MTTTWHPLERLRPVREQSLAPRFNPLQAIAPALGVLALLGGLIAIGHSGFHAEHVFEPHDALAGAGPDRARGPATSSRSKRDDAAAVARAGVAERTTG